MLKRGETFSGVLINSGSDDRPDRPKKRVTFDEGSPNQGSKINENVDEGPKNEEEEEKVEVEKNCFKRNITCPSLFPIFFFNCSLGFAICIFNGQIFKAVIADYDKNDSFETYLKQEWIIALILIPFSVLIGLLYELVQRWIILVISGITMTILMKLQAPLVFDWLLASILVGRICFLAIWLNPLVNDYVKKEHRGLIVSAEVAGFAFGQLMSNIVYFAISQTSDDLTLKNLNIIETTITGTSALLLLLAMVMANERKVDRVYGIPHQHDGPEFLRRSKVVISELRTSYR